MPPKAPKATARAARAAKRGGEETKSKTTQKKKKSRTLPTAANAPSSRPPSRASSAPSSRPPSRASVAASVADDQQDSGPSRKKNLNWIEEEDVYLCKAYVNITQDGARATNQTAETFWKRISESFMEQQSKCEVCQEKKRPIRDWGACQSRFDRRIKPSTNQYNGFYKALKDSNPSGWKEEDFIREASEKFLEKVGKPFGFEKCLPILWDCPKYDPMITDLSNDLEDVNNIGQVMGQKLPRPAGAKVQKAAASKGKKPDAASLASLETNKLVEFRKMNSNSDRIADTMEFQANVNATQAAIQACMDEAKLFNQMGMQAEAMQSLANAKAHREELERQAHEQKQTVAAAKMAALESSVAPITSVEVPDPTNEQMTERLNDEEASDEEELVIAATATAKTGPTFRSMEGALDSDDELEQDEESEHPSQPSDDSRADKNPTPTPV